MQLYAVWKCCSTESNTIWVSQGIRRLFQKEDQTQDTTKLSTWMWLQLNREYKLKLNDRKHQWQIIAEEVWSSWYIYTHVLHKCLYTYMHACIDVLKRKNLPGAILSTKAPIFLPSRQSLVKLVTCCSGILCWIHARRRCFGVRSGFFSTVESASPSQVGVEME